MKILAIDLGTTSGWAFGDTRTDYPCVHGIKAVKPLPQEGEGMRYLKFHSWFAKLVAEYQPDQVIFEDVKNHKGVIAAHIYGGLKSHLYAICEAKKIPYQGVGVGQVKKYFTGKGNAKKPEMIAEAQSRGYKPQDDNAADAIAIYYYGLALYGGRLVA